MPAFGPDFRAALRQPLYDGANRQPLWVALAAFGGCLAVQLFLPTLPYFLLLASSAEGSASSALSLDMLLMSLAALIPTSLLVVWLVFRLAGRGGEAIRATALRQVSLGWAGWPVTVLGFAVVAMLAILVLRLVSGNWSTGGVEKGVSALASRTWAPLIVVLATGVFGPIAEEFLFRGPLFAKLRGTRLGVAGTVVATSLLWALLHITEPWIGMSAIFVMGLLLGTLLLRFGSLVVPIACHCVWNLLGTLALFGSGGTPT